MKPINFNIIGAGQLGLALSHVLTRQGHSLHSVFSLSAQSRHQLITSVGQGQDCPSIQSLQTAQITFITTPDDAIADVVTQLTSRSERQKASIIMHLSGVHTSDILAPLKAYGHAVASLHPLRAFKSPQIASFNNCFCTLEGDTEALNLLSALFTHLGAKIQLIDAHQKSRYHLAATIASNYLVTLAHMSQDLMQQAGIEAHQSHEMIASLMQSTLDNITHAKTFKAALTGPLSRGDIKTLSHHLALLDDNPIKTIYQQLGQLTVPLTSHSVSEKQVLIETLNLC